MTTRNFISICLVISSFGCHPGGPRPTLKSEDAEFEKAWSLTSDDVANTPPPARPQLINGMKRNWPAVIGIENAHAGSCVATRIGPRHFLTAAHCLPPGESLLTAPKWVFVQRIDVSKEDAAIFMLKDSIAEMAKFAREAPGVQGYAKVPATKKPVSAKMASAYRHQCMVKPHKKSLVLACSSLTALDNDTGTALKVDRDRKTNQLCSVPADILIKATAKKGGWKAGGTVNAATVNNSRNPFAFPGDSGSPLLSSSGKVVAVQSWVIPALVMNGPGGEEKLYPLKTISTSKDKRRKLLKVSRHTSIFAEFNPIDVDNTLETPLIDAVGASPNPETNPSSLTIESAPLEGRVGVLYLRGYKLSSSIITVEGASRGKPAINVEFIADPAADIGEEQARVTFVSAGQDPSSSVYNMWKIRVTRNGKSAESIPFSYLQKRKDVCNMVEPARLSVEANATTVVLRNLDDRQIYYVSASRFDSMTEGYMQPDQARLSTLPPGQSLSIPRGEGVYWDPSFFLGMAIRRSIVATEEVVSRLEGLARSGGSTSTSPLWQAECLRTSWLTHQ